MDFEQYTQIVLAQIKEDLKCEVVTNGRIHSLLLRSKPREAEYLIEFYSVDEAGTLGIKIRYIIGKVNNFEEVLKCLVLNSRKYVDVGPLFTAIDPKKEGILFLLVGQLILPPNTPADEVSTLFRNHAMMNYLMFQMEFPGVHLFE